MGGTLYFGSRQKGPVEAVPEDPGQQPYSDPQTIISAFAGYHLEERKDARTHQILTPRPPHGCGLAGIQAQRCYMELNHICIVSNTRAFSSRPRGMAHLCLDSSGHLPANIYCQIPVQENSKQWLFLDSFSQKTKQFSRQLPLLLVSTWTSPTTGRC